MNVYEVYAEQTGDVLASASNPLEAEERSEVLTEQFSWIDGTTFTYRLQEGV